MDCNGIRSRAATFSRAILHPTPTLILGTLLLIGCTVRPGYAGSGVRGFLHKTFRDPQTPLTSEEEGEIREGQLKRAFKIVNNDHFAYVGVNKVTLGAEAEAASPALEAGLELAACAFFRSHGVDVYLGENGAILNKNSPFLYRKVGESIDDFTQRATQAIDKVEAECSAYRDAREEIEISGIPTPLATAAERPDQIVVAGFLPLVYTLVPKKMPRHAIPACDTLAVTVAISELRYSGLLCTSPEKASAWLRTADIGARARDAGRPIATSSHQWPGATMRVRISLSVACGPADPACADEFKNLRQTVASRQLQPMQGMLGMPTPKLRYEIRSISIEENGEVLGTMTPREWALPER